MSRTPSDKPEWKMALEESNAIGWIAFLILVLAIGFGTIFFGTDSPAPKSATPVAVTGSVK